jgi:transcription elongation factor Elf1
MYPEARYSACGELAYLPESLGKLVKLAKVPIVCVVHHGNHLYTPFFNWRNPRKVPLHTTIEKILTPEQINVMSVDKINQLLKEKLAYDEYQYQLDNNILIKDKHRAEGLHKILYKCPHCLKEGVMNSKGSKVYCEECGALYNLNENGTLVAINNETKFSKVLDWYHWERECVKEEILNGTYHFSDEVEIYGFPRCWKFIKLGNAKVRHTIEEGFVVEGEYNGSIYRILRKPIEANSLHIEFDYCYVKPLDAFFINTEDDSYLCYPKKDNVVTKLSFAVEELYQLHLKRVK